MAAGHPNASGQFDRFHRRRLGGRLRDTVVGLALAKDGLSVLCRRPRLRPTLWRAARGPTWDALLASL